MLIGLSGKPKGAALVNMQSLTAHVYIYLGKPQLATRKSPDSTRNMEDGHKKARFPDKLMGSLAGVTSSKSTR